MTFDYCVVVPAREGSGRCKDKMVRPFYENMNLVEWKLRQLTEVIPKEKIYLSTNSKVIKSIATDFGVKIHHRDDYYCKGDIAPFPEVVHNVADFLPNDHIAWCPATSPLIPPEVYIDCLSHYHQNVVENKIRHRIDKLIIGTYQDGSPRDEIMVTNLETGKTIQYRLSIPATIFLKQVTLPTLYLFVLNMVLVSPANILLILI
jgi:hypothetical protein